MGQTLLAVYREADAAAAAAQELERAHVGSARVMVDHPEDAKQAVLAEMDAEVAESWASPGLGTAMTMEMMRSATLLTVVLGTLGIPIGALIGLLLFDHTGETWEKLLVGGGLGALFFGLVGALVGGGLGVHPPDAPLAGEAGIPVRVDEPGAGAIDVLKRFEPIRVDVIVDGERRATPETEGPSGLAESIDDVTKNAADPRRRN
jgi:hypothetical protein